MGEVPEDSGAAGVVPAGAVVLPTKNFSTKKSCLLSDKQTNHVPLYFIMMVLLLLYTPEHKQQQKKIDQKIPQSYNNCNLSVPKKSFFLHTLNQIRKKSKRNVFVLTEVPKRQLLLQENKTKNQKEILAKKKKKKKKKNLKKKKKKKKKKS